MVNLAIPGSRELVLALRAQAPSVRLIGVTESEDEVLACPIARGQLLTGGRRPWRALGFKRLFLDP